MIWREEWCQRLAERLIAKAADCIPTQYRDRYHEEWLAELEAMPNRDLSRLRMAIWLRLQARSVQRALGPSLETGQRKSAAESLPLLQGTLPSVAQSQMAPEVFHVLQIMVTELGVRRLDEGSTRVALLFQRFMAARPGSQDYNILRAEIEAELSRYQGRS